MQSAFNLMGNIQGAQEAGSPDKQKGKTSSESSATAAAVQFFELFSNTLSKSSESISKSGEMNIAEQAVDNKSSRKAVSSETNLKEESRIEEKAVAERESLPSSGRREVRSREDSTRSERSGDKRGSEINDKSVRSRDEVREDGKKLQRVESVDRVRNTDEKRAEAQRASSEMAVKAKGKISLGSGKTLETVMMPAKEAVKSARETGKSRKADIRKTTNELKSRSIENVSRTAEGKKATLTNPAAINKESGDKAGSVRNSTQVQSQRPVGLEARPESQNTSGNGNSTTNNDAAPRTTGNTGINPESNSTSKEFAKALGKSTGTASRVASTSSTNSNTQVTLANATSQYNRASGNVRQTGKTGLPTRTSAEKVINQVIKAARISVQGGKEEMKILLKPQELGWLKVKITVEGQKVTAHFMAENENVKSLLEGNIAQLQNALQNQNLKATQIIVDINSQPNTNAGNTKGKEDQQKNGSEDGNELKSMEEEDALDGFVQMPDLKLVELSAVDVRI